MIISDLEHLDMATDVKQVEGGIAQLQFDFKSLVFGSTVAVSNASFDSILISTPDYNVAGIKFSFAALAI